MKTIMSVHVTVSGRAEILDFVADSVVRVTITDIQNGVDSSSILDNAYVCSLGRDCEPVLKVD